MAYAPTQQPLMSRPSPSTTDRPNFALPPMHRHRKTISTGGGRAWTEQEESYLIKSRDSKQPYKWIAEQLQKTELACRLHYHQISQNRKGRRASVPHTSQQRNPHGSSPTAPPLATSAVHRSISQQQLPAFSPPTSPEDRISSRSYPATPDLSDSRHSRTSSDNSVHRFIKPDNAVDTNNTHNRPILPRPFFSPPRPSQDTRTLRLVTDTSDRDTRQYVDIARLDRIYNEQRLGFWSSIAQHYGANLSPAALEDAWRRANHISQSSTATAINKDDIKEPTSSSLPTPHGSPQKRAGYAFSNTLPTPYSAGGFTPVNSAMEKRVAISDLLS